jgi:hypothetical protein
MPPLPGFFAVARLGLWRLGAIRPGYLRVVVTAGRGLQLFASRRAAAISKSRQRRSRTTSVNVSSRPRQTSAAVIPKHHLKRVPYAPATLGGLQSGVRRRCSLCSSGAPEQRLRKRAPATSLLECCNSALFGLDVGSGLPYVPIGCLRKGVCRAFSFGLWRADVLGTSGWPRESGLEFREPWRVFRLRISRTETSA